MLIHDTAATTARTRTPEGFLRVKARIARTGVHLYKAGELGTPEAWDRNGTIRVWRPPEAVFDPDAMASFASKPVTDEHPPSMIDATNWKHYAIGHSGPEVTREGDHLVTDLLITDAEAVRRAEAGAQLSNGYHADFDFTPGTTPEGDSYDALQSNIRGNHIALVDAGRCGDSCRIGDAASGDCGCSPAMPLTEVTIDGIGIETTQAGADALARLKLNLEAKDGAIAALTAKVLDETVIEALVAERATVIDAARASFGQAFTPQGKTTGEIRRAVVSHLLEKRLDDQSDTYVAAAFDTLLLARRPANPLSSHLAAAIHDAVADRDAARRKRDHFLSQAWKAGPKTGDR